MGFSTAVRVGNSVQVSGLVAADEQGKIVGIDDPYAQTVQILKRLERALGEAGAKLQDVVSTRVYVTNIEDWKQVAKAHGEVFGDIRPAATLVQVNRLINPAALVEIEATALLSH